MLTHYLYVMFLGSDALAVDQPDCQLVMRGGWHRAQVLLTWYVHLGLHLINLIISQVSKSSYESV
jgi:hypothetical protein